MGLLMNNKIHIQPETFSTHGTFKRFVWLFWWNASCESKIKLFPHVLWDFSPLWMLMGNKVRDTKKVHHTFRTYYGLEFWKQKQIFPTITAVFRVILVALLGEGKMWGLPEAFHTVSVLVLGGWCVHFLMQSNICFLTKVFTRVGAFIGFFASVGFLMLCQSWEAHV